MFAFIPSRLGSAKRFSRDLFRELSYLTERLFASRSYRVARAALGGLATIYAAGILLQMSRSYGFGSDAILATAETLNSNAYDMSAMIAGTIPLGGYSASGKRLEYILVCAPLTVSSPDHFALAEQWRKNIASQLKWHAGPVYIGIKHAVEAGDSQFAIHLRPGNPDSLIALLPSDPPHCEFNFHEVDRYPASIYYDPSICNSEGCK